MRIERTKNAARSTVFGWILSIYKLVVPFAMRTAMIYFMGVQYLGLNSLFTSVLSVLNLAELGVGSAMVYSMYKPIAEDDTEKICALMRLYRTYYRIIGLVIAVAGVILIPFLPKLVKGSIPSELNLYVLYLLNLTATVLTYWLFAYRNCLLMAHQRNDVSSKVSLVTITLQYGVQFLVIIFLKDYYLYVIALLITQILSNIMTALITKKMYPDYLPQGTVSKESRKMINRRIKDLFTAKIGAVVVLSADTIVISAFLGLRMLAIYQNYFYLLTAVQGLIGIALGACMAGIGNSLIVESQKKNLDDLNKLTFIISWVSGVCTCCFLCLYQPFMKLWVGEDLMLKYGAVICFAVYFYVMEINQLLNIYKDAGGLWHEDRFRPIVVAISNLSLNLLLVNFWGIYGVLLSTVVTALFVGMPWLLHNLFTVLFEKKHLKGYLYKTLSYGLFSFIACGISVSICHFIPLSGVLQLIVNLLVSIIIPNTIFFFAYKNRDEFKSSLALVDSLTKNKLKLKKRLLREK